jgi:hypothetical protein
MSKQDKAPKGAKADGAKASKADVANATLVREALAIAGKSVALEFPLLEKFGRVMASGKLSQKGFEATLEAITQAGGYLPSLRAGHKALIVIAWELSALDGAPKVIGELVKLADHLVRNLSAEQIKALDVANKTEGALLGAREAIKQGKSFTELREATPTPQKKDKGASGSRSGEASDYVASPSAIKALAEGLEVWLATGAPVSVEQSDALIELSAIIERMLAQKVARKSK